MLPTYLGSKMAFHMGKLVEFELVKLQTNQTDVVELWTRGMNKIVEPNSSNRAPVKRGVWRVCLFDEFIIRRARFDKFVVRRVWIQRVFIVSFHPIHLILHKISTLRTFSKLREIWREWMRVGTNKVLSTAWLLYPRSKAADWAQQT